MLVVCLLLRSWAVAALSPEIQPVVYYRFEDATSPGEDSMNNFKLKPTNASTLQLPRPRTTGGAVGSYLAFDGSNPSQVLAANAGTWNCSGGAGMCDGITVEFLLRPNQNFNLVGETPVLSSRGAANPGHTQPFQFEALLGRHAYGLHAGVHAYGFPLQLIPGEDVLAKLGGTGRASQFWLLDGRWHHFAMRKKPTTGGDECFVDIWIDGQSPPGFNSSGAAVPVGTCNFLSSLPRILLPSAFGGDIDEVAVWETALTDTHIAAHAAGALQHGLPYVFTDPGGKVPPPDPTGGSLNLQEFAPGTQLPTPLNSKFGTQGVNISCLDQLKSFPAPRFAVRTRYPLPPLSNCMDPQYMAGENQPNVSKETMINTSLAIQAELAAHWHYGIFWGNLEQLEIAKHSENLVRTIQLANEHPEWPFELSIIRANIYNISQPRSPHNKPAISSQELPSVCYLQNQSGDFIGYDGEPVKIGQYGPIKKKRLWTAAGGQKHGCPDSLFDSDGEWFRQAFASIAKHNVTVPAGALRVWEDGEIFTDTSQVCGFPVHAASALEPILLVARPC